jgi:acyl-CoA thioester hydrolase
MSKPDPALLDPARYPHQVEIAPRYADLDPNNHLNNVALAAIIEDARVRFHHASGFAKSLGPKGQVMIAQLNISYFAQCYYPAPITVCTGVAKAGNTSMRLLHLLVQDGRPAVLAEAVVVHVEDGKAAPLPEALSAHLEQWTCR